MKKALYPVIAFLAALLSVAVSGQGFQDELLDRLAGDWVMKGTIAGQEVTHDVRAEWVLGHNYIRFHEVSRERTETGVPEYTGYKLIHTSSTANDTVFRDDNDGVGLIPGIDYCYIITTIFNDGAESYASEEVCTSLKKDVPIITNVSNDSSNLIAGRAFIAWSKPTELDTVQTPPPYQYIVKRAEGLSGCRRRTSRQRRQCWVPF